MKLKSLYVTYMGLSEPLLYSQVLNYLKMLSRKGVSVHILSFEKSGLLNKEEENLINKDMENAGIKWTFLRYHKRFQFLSKPYDVIMGMFFILFIAIRNKIDIIHARGTFCALMGFIPCSFLRKKMIFDMRGLMAEEYADAGSWKRGSFIYNFINSLEGYFIRNADEVILLNKRTQEMVLKKDKAKNITIIPTCVDLERFNVRAEADNEYDSKKKFILIYVGSLGTWYMLSEMLDFYKELIIYEPNSVFYILSQTQREWIQGYIPDNIKNNIIIDTARPIDVSRVLNRADVGIFFIKPCLSKTASCPTKFGEYLACGLPVVINRGIGDTEEIVKRERVGVVITDFSREAYKRSIIELEELLKEGEVLRKRCHNVAERYFSLNEGAEKYAKIYARLAQRRD